VLGRPLDLVAESDLNDTSMVTPTSEGGRGMTAQWDDDVHHALHAALSGERQGYYCDFGSLATLAKALTCAFVHDGTYSTFRGHNHGRPVDRAHIPGSRFVAFLQNHDQVGNRAAGDRLPETVSPGLLRVGATLLLTAPFVPMLWMGEEWAASTRWPFFTSHPEAELNETTGPGRVAEFARHGWDASQMIDPQDPAAYRAAILDWHEPERPGHREMLALYRSLIRLRATQPDLDDPDLTQVHVEFDEDSRWLAVHRGGLRVLANFDTLQRQVPVRATEILLATAECHARPDGILLAGESAAIVRAG
jgi:maltooligosyltrehalose trehalohydrolase